MKYNARSQSRRWPRRFLVAVAALLVAALLAMVAIRYVYNQNLKPVSSSTKSVSVTIESGTSSKAIAGKLKKLGLIRSTWAFEWYISSKEVRAALQAGTYSLQPDQSTPQIVEQLTHGLIATHLVTILPAQRLDQIRVAFKNAGFSTDQINRALDPTNYAKNATLVDKPAGASLEGYLYPDSFQKDSDTKLSTIVNESLTEMGQHLTPDIRAAFAAQGLSTYQGVILASIVEQEVSNASDRAQAAQVFLTRLRSGISLGSDVTAFYGAVLAGQKPSVNYDSAYNTRLHTGLPPTPISNVSDSSLQAVAHPANTNWLFFVSGDDGKTYFSHTVQEHEQQTQQYCHKLCQQ
ncbi:MAG TPA: endolytic transglycosylase MltG [Candidatus Saccharimonadales bacterium]|nr:endolytic transglycosylase MltG [Candidatus Saccharimonadales bacterium]